MKKVGIIGAGIFGISVALELSKVSDVTVFEKSGEILSGASTNNHLRHHFGYHYPRSPKTAMESIAAGKSFEAAYGDCVDRDFPAYYAVSKRNSKTTTQQFVSFCASLDLPLKRLEIDPRLVNPDRVDAFFSVPEPIYDPKKLQRLIEKRLSGSSVKMRFESEIVGARIAGDQKVLRYVADGKTQEESFDIVIGAVYVNFNDINKWFGFPRKKFLYELVELLEIRLPSSKRFGLTLIDGEFSSVLPRGSGDTFTLGHVKESVLKEIVSDDAQKDLLFSGEMRSNREGILRAGAADFPILSDAVVVRSIFVPRIVKAGVDATDERPTEITDHGHGIYSIFGGKVITCV
ncbi:MAG: FAD-dependent oxidoreductase, partial [Candidatus Diapherotrites archaeon]|nr:FAD-dependent oxidoreductase [Candidatus Diapherotrites archaeon]